jgi:hypothetical protein
MCDPKSLFKTLIAALVLAFTTQAALAGDETRAARERLENVTPFRFPDRITTLDGKTYAKVILERAEPDGLLVLFSPAEGGLGAAKLKFRNLPAELRERYGYDPMRASDFEAAQERGAAAWRAENAIWTEQRQAALAEQAAWGRQMRAEAESRREEQARAEAVRYAQEQPVSYYAWGGSSYFNCDSYGGGRRFRSHAQQPALGITCSTVSPRCSPVSPHIGPMRPLGK